LQKGLHPASSREGIATSLETSQSVPHEKRGLTLSSPDAIDYG
jgi:hypothetical protein